MLAEEVSFTCSEFTVTVRISRILSPTPILLHKGEYHIFIVTSHVPPHSLLDSTNHKDGLKMVPRHGSGYEIGAAPRSHTFLDILTLLLTFLK